MRYNDAFMLYQSFQKNNQVFLDGSYCVPRKIQGLELEENNNRESNQKPSSKCQSIYSLFSYHRILQSFSYITRFEKPFDELNQSSTHQTVTVFSLHSFIAFSFLFTKRLVSRNQGEKTACLSTNSEWVTRSWH